MTCDDALPLLDADLDRELDALRSAELGRHLATCASCRARMDSLVALRDAIRARGERPAIELGFERRLAASLPRRRVRLPVGPLALAAAVILVAGVTLLRPRPNLDGALVDAHVRSLEVEHLTDVASSDRHTVKPWFQGKLDYAFGVPDLVEQGFPLVGGRLDVLDGVNTGVLVYRRRQHVINVFVSPDLLPEGARSERGFNVLGWSAGGLHYEAVSDVNAADLVMLRDLMLAAK